MNKLEAIQDGSPGDTKTCRGRPRSVQSHETILNAVLALLEKEGYGRVTIEGVARHAGVGKQTIYRWWRCKAELVLEALAKHAEIKLPMPDQGSLRGDLEAFLTMAFLRLTQNTGPIMRGLMADAVLDSEFGYVLREAFISKRRHALRQVLERGVKRGEIANGADLELMMDMIYGPMWYRLLVQHAQLDMRVAKHLTDAILEGFGKRG